MEIVLHGYWRSSSSWRVRSALNWKGLSYENKPVHLVANGGEQYSANHSELNPMHEVPVLVVDGKALAQSVAIIEYLEELYPEPSLFPESPIDRARVRQMIELINSGIQPIQNLRVMQRLGGDYNLSRAQQLCWSRRWIDDGLRALNVLVERYGGRYCFGDNITAADLFLVPQIYNARRFGVDLAKYQKLLDVEACIEKHPQFAASHPERQVDAVAV